MMWKRSLALALCGLGIGALAAGRAEATVIATETFSYADGLLDGKGAAAGGFAGAWRLGCCGTPVYSVTAGELTMPGATGADNNRAHRDLAADLGADNTSVFIGIDYEFANFYNGFELHNDGDGDGQRVLQLAYEGATQFLRIGADPNFNTIDFVDQVGTHRYVIELAFGTGGGDSAKLYIDGLQVGSTPLTAQFTADRISFGSFLAPGPSSADNVIIATTFAEANAGEETLSCDFNSDGDCDSGDFATLRDNMYTNGTFADGDANLSGFIDFADYRIFKDHPSRVVGNLGGGSGSLGLQIPEPVGAMSLTIAVLVLGGLNNRYRRMFA